MHATALLRCARGALPHFCTRRAPRPDAVRAALAAAAARRVGGALAHRGHPGVAGLAAVDEPGRGGGAARRGGLLAGAGPAGEGVSAEGGGRR
eukprot:4459893-Prymnesium_polylepis.1